ncbi:uncharacterized protein K02A2.6-like [Topomyia yanbarensis]|uniref:uncharacterized protein K02A2.6-like n=1 Tax=Topomyia yanbarensis TaxID=2498891 RepID=UPI00273C7CB2|nr:uncharacterized protein K02A2.6-like [Topomyia yanbarensis]
MPGLWKEIEIVSEADEELISVRLALQSGNWPENIRRFHAQMKELRSLGSLIFNGDRIVLPEALRYKAIKASHQGHIGCGAMKRIIREYFWWPGLSSEVEKFVKSCETCLVISRRNPSIPLCSRELPDGPWEILQVDLLSINNCGSGEFLVLVDTYSRYLAVAEIKSTDAKNTNLTLAKIFYTWGLPLILQSDNGPPFQGKEFIDYWQNKGVKIRKSLPLSAQSNGAVERQNQGILKAIAGAKEDGLHWKEALQNYVHVHNTLKPHFRLCITPFELLVGWKYRGTFPSLWKAKSSEELDRYEIRDRDALSKLISKTYADSHRGAKASDIKAGDKVIMAVPKKPR